MNQLQFEKLLSVAIKREVEAHEFYQDVAGRVKDTVLKTIFDNLAKQEMAHRDLLEHYRLDVSLPIKFKAPPDLKVAETLDAPTLSVNMKPADAIALAMKKEQQAVEFYHQLAQMCDDPELKQAYDNLAKMELGHKHVLEEAFVDIGYPESF